MGWVCREREHCVGNKEFKKAASVTVNISSRRLHIRTVKFEDRRLQFFHGFLEQEVLDHLADSCLLINVLNYH